MKFYAVKNGRKPGIYESWEECKAQVDGFSGAEYKSFAKRDDALSFLGTAPEAKKAENYAYVDGSYNIETQEFSFGAVVFLGEEIKVFSQKFKDADMATMRNVAGEIKGAEFVIKYCSENGIKSIDIYYDYEGIAAWAEGRWKRNREGTIAYKKLFDELSKKVSVRFVKVKGHSGDKYNDLADALAKQAAGVAITQKAQNEIEKFR